MLNKPAMSNGVLKTETETMKEQSSKDGTLQAERSYTANDANSNHADYNHADSHHVYSNHADTEIAVDAFNVITAMKNSESQSLGEANESLSNWSMKFDDDLLSLFRDFDLNGGGTMGTSAVASLVIDRYVAPIIVVLGLIGNIISLMVFTERTMWRRSSSVYLAALSAVDIAFLTCVLLSWTAQTRVDLYAVEGLCQTFTYITYVSSFLGVWYVVGFTIERYVAVHYPLRRQSLCTAAKARRSAAALAAFAAVVYSFGTWTSGVTVINADYRMCGPMTRYVVALTVVHAIDTVITLLLPFIAITVLNLRIAITVVRCNRDRRTMSTISVRGRLIETDAGASRSRTRASVAAGNAPDSHRQSLQEGSNNPTTGARHYVSGVSVSNGNDQFRVTKLLLTVSAAFLVLNLPRHAVRTYSFVIDLVHPYQPPSPAFLVYQKLFLIVYYLQFAVNIILYATIGRSNFIGALRRIAHRSRRRMANAATWLRLLSVAVGQFTGYRRRTNDTGSRVSRRPLGPALNSLIEHQMVILMTSGGSHVTSAAVVQPDANSHVSIE